MQTLILTLDQAGLPQAWVGIEEAITYHAKRLVAWSAGNPVCEYRGGMQRDGRRSRIETQSSIASKALTKTQSMARRKKVQGDVA